MDGGSSILLVVRIRVSRTEIGVVYFLFILLSIYSVFSQSDDKT
jgi:hypothetical protein